MIRASLLRRLAIPVLLLAVFSPVSVSGDEPGVREAGYEALMEGAHSALLTKIPLLARGRLEEIGEALQALPRQGLSDDEWLDLHIVLQEIRRRLDPPPRYAEKSLPASAYLEAIPRAPSLDPDPVALLDTASTLHRLRSPAGAPPPRGRERKSLAAAAKRARDLAVAAAALTSADDALLRASASVLSEEATDLAFDLRCRAEGRVPSGSGRFEWLLSHRHRVNLDVDRLRAIGEAERQATLAALRELAATRGEGRTWRELTAASGENHPPDSEALLEFCRGATAEALSVARASGLVTIPEHATHLEVVPCDGSPLTPYAHYRPGGLDERGRYRGRAAYTRMPAGLSGGAAERWLRDRSPDLLTYTP